MNIKKIDGGITAPKGFKCAGIHSGLRKNKSKKDLALIVADKDCNAAGTFTTNKVFAAPVGVTKEKLKNGIARAIICNSGNANACTPDGYFTSNAICDAAAEVLSIPSENILIASTGVIGVPLPHQIIVDALPEIKAALADTAEASNSAAAAIMTTDTRKKEFAYEFTIGEKTARIAGICKGSGMIHPNMATMLGFVTTDAAVSSDMLSKALKSVIRDTFNMVSVDGDTSTNDMVVVLASGEAGNDPVSSENDAGYTEFKAALFELCKTMAMSIAADGEGATKLLECTVSGFSDEDGAKALAKSVICSSLVKAAMFGADANWGRIICALGYSAVPFDTSKVDIYFASKAGEIKVCENGMSYEFDEDIAKEILTKNSIKIIIDMKSGSSSATAWGCDLSYEYVRINGDYRS